MARDVRTTIIQTAMRLFEAEGSRAVGVDRIIAEAQVAKASFYHHFPSKQALLIATLEVRDGRVRDWLCTSAERLAAERSIPAPLALFDVVQDWAGGDGFHGCAFLHAVFDSPTDTDARKVAALHKQRLQEWIAAGLDVRLPRHETAAGVMVLLDGGVAQAFIHRDPARVEVARAIATRLLETDR